MVIDICFAIRDAVGTYSKYVGVAMCSLLENTDVQCCFHVLHDGTLCDVDKGKMVELVTRYGAIIKFYEVKMPSMPIDYENLQRFTIATLFRLKLPEILMDVKRVIYLDADLVVNLDIEQLWQVNLCGKSIAGCVDTATDIRKYLCEIGLIEIKNYINAGVLILDLQSIRKKMNLLQKSIDFFIQYPKTNYYDQDALNYIFKGDILYLPGEYNTSSVWSRRMDEAEKAKVYHFFGDCPRDFALFAVDRLWIKYFQMTPWGNRNFIINHYSVSILEKERQMAHVRDLFYTISNDLVKKKVFWGVAGAIHLPIMQSFKLKQQDYFIDNNEAVWGKMHFNHRICSPKTLLTEEKDKIIIIVTTFRYKEVKEQLEGYNLVEGVHFFNAKYLIPEVIRCKFVGERACAWDLSWRR